MTKLDTYPPNSYSLSYKWIPELFLPQTSLDKTLANLSKLLCVFQLDKTLNLSLSQHLLKDPSWKSADHKDKQSLMNCPSTQYTPPRPQAHFFSSLVSPFCKRKAIFYLIFEMLTDLIVWTFPVAIVFSNKVSPIQVWICIYLTILMFT